MQTLLCPSQSLPHGLCHSLLWHLSLLILKPFCGVEESLAVFQCHAGATGDSRVPRASASGRLSWPLFPSGNCLPGPERLVQSEGASSLRVLLLPLRCSLPLPTLEDIMGVVGGETRKTKSSWSHILRSIFYLTSGQRALTLMAKNVVSLFSGSTKAPSLKRWELQSNWPSRWGLRWKQRMQGGWVRGHSPSYGTNKILLSFSHNLMMWFLLSTPFYRQWAKS